MLLRALLHNYVHVHIQALCVVRLLLHVRGLTGLAASMKGERRARTSRYTLAYKGPDPNGSLPA